MRKGDKKFKTLISLSGKYVLTHIYIVYVVEENILSQIKYEIDR
jgi:hypothetical protein